MAPLVMADLHLTRTQFGVLAGFAFIALFSVAGLLLGTAVDRFSRTRLIAAGLAVWSLMTAASGAAQGFGHLAAARVLVGVGEATLIPAAVSLLVDVIPPPRLALAAAILTSATPVGQALSYAVASLLAPQLGWRGCFFLLGGIGLVLVGPLLAVSDPPRLGATSSARPGAIVSQLARTLVRVPSARLTLLGVAAFGYANGAALHTIPWLVQERGFTAARAAALAGLITAAAGLLGNLVVGALADRREKRAAGGRASTLALLAPFLALTSFVLYSTSPSSPVFYAAWVLSTAGLLGWLGAAIATYEPLVPPQIRGTAIAFAVFCLNVLGLGPGAFVTGWLGDTVSLSHGLRVSAGVALLASIPFALSAARYRSDCEKARASAGSAAW
jgi:MFS transporter, Spinster family, sphingosine-1-phosphate transporter